MCVGSVPELNAEGDLPIVVIITGMGVKAIGKY